MDLHKKQLSELPEIFVPRDAEFKTVKEDVTLRGVNAANASQVNAEMVHISKMPEDFCHTCEQQVGKETREKRAAKLMECQRELDTIEVNISKAEQAKEYWEEELGKAMARQEEMNQAVRESVQVQHLEKRLKDEIHRCEIALSETGIPELEQKLDLLKNQENPYSDQLSSMGNDLTVVLGERSQQGRYVKVLRDELSHLSYWNDAFSKGLKNLMLARACPFLDQKTEQHLQGLGNAQLRVSFSTTKLLKSGDTAEDFNVSVHSTTGGRGFQSLSGGEQQMVSFAVGLALADLAETQVEGSSHLLILDEPFMALDGRNCENIVNYLRGPLSKRRETILLISNEEALRSLIPNRIHVIKSGGVTRLGEIGATHEET
jgi:DNA repair exonuclease SbcCD ATPase subunit